MWKTEDQTEQQKETGVLGLSELSCPDRETFGGYALQIYFPSPCQEKIYPLMQVNGRLIMLQLHKMRFESITLYFGVTQKKKNYKKILQNVVLFLLYTLICIHRNLSVGLKNKLMEE